MHVNRTDVALRPCSPRLRTCRIGMGVLYRMCTSFHFTEANLTLVAHRMFVARVNQFSHAHSSQPACIGCRELFEAVDWIHASCNKSSPSRTGWVNTYMQLCNQEGLGCSERVSSEDFRSATLFLNDCFSNYCYYSVILASAFDDAWYLYCSTHLCHPRG